MSRFPASRGLSRALAAVIAGLILPGSAATGSPEAAPRAIPVEQRGLPVGATIPDLRARDQAGREASFTSLVGPKGLVLLFVRSADW